MKKLVVFLLILSPFNNLLAQKGYYITSPDKIKLFVNEYGAGKPVVLLAGGPGMNATYLKPVWDSLAGYRCIVPDQRGTGKSVLAKIDSATISVNQYVDDLESLRIHLKLPKLSLVGHSWGAMLAMAYTAKYPEKVERLVLLNAGGITANFFYYFGDNINMRLHDDDIAEGKIPDKTGINELRSIWPGYFFSRERALATKAQLTVEAIGDQNSDLANIAFKNYAATSNTRTSALMALKDTAVKDYDKASSFFDHKYKNPAFIIQGRQDPVGEATAYETKIYLPQAKIIMIERCGHFPWLEDKQTVSIFYLKLKIALLAESVEPIY